MKKIIKFLCAFYSAFLILFCVSCSRTVNFDIEFVVDNEVYSTISTTGEEVIQMPKNPEKEGFIFDGWYWDNNFWRKEFTAKSLLDTPLNENLRVYAHFINSDDPIGTELNIVGSKIIHNDNIGDSFYIEVPNSKLILSFSDIVNVNPNSSWELSTDLYGNNVINSKTIDLIVGDNPLFYITVKDKNENAKTYNILVRRRPIYTICFNCDGGTECDPQFIEESFKLENIPSSTKQGYTFKGWDYDFNNPILKNLEVNALWEANEYIIYLDADGGKLECNEITTTTDEYFKLSNPTKEGYIFDGWFEDNIEYESGIFNFAKNLHLKAKWTPVIYDITYELDKGTFSESDTLKNEYTIEDEYTLPKPTRIGNNFVGWKINNGKDTFEEYTIENGSMGDKTFTAIWEAIDYEITYDVNGGDPLESEKQTYNYDEETKLIIPTKTGYKFKGWYDKEILIQDFKEKYNTNLTLTAKWEIIEYNISYDLDKGKLPSDNKIPKFYTYEEEVIIPNPTKDGYTFIGWKVNENEEFVMDFVINKNTVGDIALTANWKLATYNIIYVLDVENDKLNQIQKVKYLDKYELLDPTKLGYDFSGWYLDGEYFNKTDKYEFYEDITLVAKWSPITYKITYNLNNGQFDADEVVNYSYTIEDEIALLIPSRLGNTFAGWKLSDGTVIEKYIIKKGSVGNKIFTATWTPIPYTITYDVNGGNSLENNTQVYYYDDDTILLNPSRSGYKFLGWYYNDVLVSNKNVKYTEDLTLKAKWELIDYAILYDLDNGQLKDGDTIPEYYTYIDNVMIPNPVKDGYTFIGWNVNDNNELFLDYVIEENNTGDIYLLACWSANNYNLTIDVNGGNPLNNNVFVQTFDKKINFIKPTKTGYYIKEWINVETNEVLNLSDAWTYSKDVEAKAIWEPCEYQITLNFYDEYRGESQIIRNIKYDSIMEFPNISFKGHTLTGWFDSDGNSYSNGVWKTVGNLEINAKWELSKYTITYIEDDNNPELNKTQIVEYSSSYELYVPSKVGYTFNGWYLDDKYFDKTENYDYDYDISLVAKWTANRYSVSLNTNGGDLSSSNTVYVTFDSLFELDEPSRTGYTFMGWFMDNELVQSGIYQYNHNLELTAKWEANTHKIVFDVNGGSQLDNDTLYVVYDSEVTLPKPIRVGYTFAGWYNLDNKIIDGIWKIDSDVNLIANYEIINYDIVYNLDGGSHKNVSSYNYECTDIKLMDPSKVGYTFIGWTDINNVEPKKGLVIKHNSVGNLEFTAHWIANKYLVTLDVNNGDSLENNTINIYYDNDLLLPLPTRTGYQFAGWYYEERLIENGKYTIPEDITLIAKWNPNKYTINKYIDGIKYTYTVNYDSYYNLYKPNKNNFTFVGYYTEPYGKGVQITDNEADSLDKYLYLNDLDVYSYFVYTVQFVTNGGENIDSVTLDDNQILDYSIVAQKANRTFGGWYLDAMFNNPMQYSNPIGNKKIYAKWNEEVLPTNLKLSSYINGISIDGSNGLENETKLIIPDYIGGIRVVHINNNAFSNKLNLITVEIPDTVTSIGRSAFYQCNSLTNIKLPFIGSELNAIGEVSNTFGYIFGYTTSSNSNLVVQRYNKNQEAYYYIPKSIRNVVVTKQTVFGTGAFMNCNFIESITIPENTLEIGEYFAYECNNLNKLNSDVLGTINIPETVNIINKCSFYKCNSFVTLNMSNDITKIDDYAFAHCTSITKVNSNTEFELKTPNNLKYLGIYSFDNLPLIKTIIVNDSIECIEKGTFYKCNALENITLPFIGKEINTKDLPSSVFGYIFNIASSSGNGIVQQKYTSNSSSYYYIPENIKNITITKQTIFSSGSFMNLHNVENISIPTNTTEIGEYCFFECNKLNRLNSVVNYVINIPLLINSIPRSSFNRCYQIKEVNLSNNVTKIDLYAFAFDSAIEKFNSVEPFTMKLPTNCKYIGEQAFLNNKLIKNLFVGENVETIENGSFAGMFGLENITLPFIGKTLNDLNEYNSLGHIFKKCSSDEENAILQHYSPSNGNYYAIPHTIKNITILKQTIYSYGAFENCSFVESINIPEDTSLINGYAFANCKSLKRLNSEIDYIYNIPYQIKNIPLRAFYNCQLVKEVNLSDDITSISDYAFCNLISLEKLNSDAAFTMNVPSGCVELGEYAFYNCKLIKDIIIHDNVVTINENVLGGCNQLENLTIPFIGRENNTTDKSSSVFGYLFGIVSSSDNGAIYQRYARHSSMYYRIPTTIKSVIITKQTNIGYGMFYNCSFIEHITIPETVSVINGEAFYNCKGLRTLNSDIDLVMNIPLNVKEINYATFYYCELITEVNLSNEITLIYDYAFELCKSINKFNSINENTLEIPKKTVKIGQYAFKNLKNIHYVIVNDNVETIGAGAFQYESNLIEITLPFIGENISKNQVLGYIFGECSSSENNAVYQKGSNGSSKYYSIPVTLEKVNITKQTIFGYGTFYNCKNLKNINIPKDTISIGDYMFYDCIQLSTLNSNVEGKVELPVNISKLPTYCFAGCNSIYKFNSDLDFTLNLNNNINYIDSFAFLDVKLMRHVIVNDNVTYIGNAAFSRMRMIEDIELPFIGKEIDLLNGKESLFGHIFGSGSSGDTYSIAQYYEENYVTYYMIPKTIKEVTITKQTIFGYGAFSNCDFIEKIEIPTNTKYIGGNAFRKCSNLKQLNSSINGVYNLPLSVSKINDFTFKNCTSLSEFSCSNNITYIGIEAFYNCCNLKKFNSNDDFVINTPNSCQTVGKNAFYNCKLIQKVNFTHKISLIGEGALKNCNSINDLTVPFVGSKNGLNGTKDSVLGYVFGLATSSDSNRTAQYYTTNNYAYYFIPQVLKNIVVTNQSDFGYGAFYNCSSILSITLLKDALLDNPNILYNCNAVINKTLDLPVDVPWDGKTIATSFKQGDGSINNPIIIESASELAYLSKEVNSGKNFNNTYFKLNYDIDLNNNNLIIGTDESHIFGGIINGNGHIIKNIKVESNSSYAGLFGYFNGQLSNIGFENVNISNITDLDNSYAGIIGYADVNTKILNVYSNGNIYSNAKTNAYAGGLIGYMNGGTIDNSYSAANVKAESVGFKSYSSGLVGYINSGNINNSFATGEITSNGSNSNFSYVDNVAYNSTNNINNCYCLNSQKIYIKNNLTSYKNELIKYVDLNNLTGKVCVNQYNWDSNVWNSNEDLPKFLFK